jgi:hypothetical protein
MSEMPTYSLTISVSWVIDDATSESDAIEKAKKAMELSDVCEHAPYDSSVRIDAKLGVNNAD